MSKAASYATYDEQVKAGTIKPFDMLPAAKKLKADGYKILVVNLPMTGEWVYRRFMESLMGMIMGDAYMYFLADKIKICVNINSDFPICANRNKATRVAIEKFGADYIMNLDTDQTFHASTIMNLWDSMHKPAPDGSEIEAVAGMYFMKHPPFKPVLGPFTGWEQGMDAEYLDKHGFLCDGECGQHAERKQLVRWCGPHFWPEDKLFRADVIGVGCVLTRASMWKRLQYPFFRYSPDPMHGQEKGNIQEISEDMFWCANMHKAGVKVWIDPRVQCGHIGILEAEQGHFRGGFEAAQAAVEKMTDEVAKKKWKEALVDVR